jgi:hypothetical protein
MAKRKITVEELVARAESSGYKRGAHREKDSTRDENRHINRPLHPVRDQYLPAIAKTGADTS